MDRMNVSFELKAVSDDGGTFEGYGAVFGNIDRGGDIILAGAFKETLPRFLKEGVIAWQHDWSEPIGRPMEAREDAKGLFIKASISDTTRGRDARTLMKDRVIQRMSIGYETLDSVSLNADNIADYVDTAAVGMRELDKAFRWGRALKKVELYEVSPVSVPMNPEADITAVKSILRAGMPFDVRSEAVLAAVEEYAAQLKELRDLRAKDGRPLSETNRERLRTLSTRMKDLNENLHAFCEDVEKPVETPESQAQAKATAQAAFARFLQTDFNVSQALRA